MHCSLATGGPGAAMPHAPFGRPRRPLGTFPRGESTSSARRRTKPLTRNRFLMEGKGKSLYILFCFSGAFASAEATKGLSDRPLETFGSHPVEADGDHKKIDFLRKARERAFTFFFCFSEDFASAEATKGLSGRPLETFGAHPVEADGDHKKIDFLRKARERTFTFFFLFLRRFRLCGGDQGAFRSPFGNLRGPPC